MQKMILGNFQIRKCEKTRLLETKTRTEMSVELKNQKLWNKTRTSPTNANGVPRHRRPRRLPAACGRHAPAAFWD